MTNKELQEELTQFPDDYEVLVNDNSGMEAEIVYVDCVGGLITIRT